jgi:16S rRNA (guanine527-N7)-methyltransferase
MNDIAPADVVACLTRVGLDAAQAAALADYLNLLDQWNRVHNLTGIRRRDELLQRHLVESLALAPYLLGPGIADVGTGAGLPGLPLAICCPQFKFTLVESRKKRVSFLRHVAAALKLSQVEVAHCRAETLAPADPYSTVLARAVAPPAELLALCRPLLAPEGRLLLLTSAALGREIIGLAADLDGRIVEPDPRMGLKSSIVVLDRRGP